jgi:hypothetical protein
MFILVLYLARPPPLFSLGSDFSLNCDQELKERSCRKSQFIRHESGMWVSNKRLSKKSAEADELRVVTTALKEEATQARDAAAKAHEDMAKA